MTPDIARLEAKHFAHPLDLAARGRVDRLVTRRPRIRKFFEALERGTEDEQYLKNLADNTRLSPEQLRWVDEVAAEAGMPTPRVLTAELVDGFDARQIRAVVAHELGHIRCQHTFYRTVAQGFGPVSALASTMPGGALLALALHWHILDWYRKSELSADRFASLVTGDLDLVQSVILRLAGGTAEQFRLQAQEYRDTVAMRKPVSGTDRVEYYASGLMVETVVATHPWPALRFVELEEWAVSSQYQCLLKGDLEGAAQQPFQRLPDTAPDEEFDENQEPLGEPVLRQAAAELSGKFKEWTTKATTPSASPPPSWYPDPNGAGQLRYWDGGKWTEHVRPL